MTKTLITALGGAVLVGSLAACSTPGSVHTFSPADGMYLTTPAATTPPPASPAPSGFKPKVLLDYSGTGPGNTPVFSTSVNGNYTVYWSYSGNDYQPTSYGAWTNEFGISENFAVAGPGYNDGSGFPTDMMPDSGSGVIPVTGDPGTHNFSVSAIPACHWHIKVVAEP